MGENVNLGFLIWENFKQHDEIFDLSRTAQNCSAFQGGLLF